MLNPSLVDIHKFELGPELKSIFARLDLVPIYNLSNSLIIFAKNSQGQVHLVNRHILEHMIESQTPDILFKEFSVSVADNLEEFLALFDRGLIPLSFYEQLDHPNRLFNFSGFDVQKFERNVLFALLIFKLNSTKHNFDHLRHLDQKDKLNKGGNLADYIQITLKRLNQSGKVLAIKIGPDVSYENFKKNKLIPRLNVSIFIS